ncbi:MAG: hypothetical protein R3D63_13535 [Paracoccaceae bacterium]
MDARFPPLARQCQIDRRARAVSLHMPSLPWGEWLVALTLLMALAAV